VNEATVTPKPNPADWIRTWMGKPVAWTEGDRQYAGLVIRPGLLTDADGFPTKVVVALQPQFSAKHPDGQFANLDAGVVPDANAAWREAFLPPMVAEQINSLIAAQAKVEDKREAKNNILKALLDDEKFAALPPDVEMLLTCNEADALPDTQGDVHKVDDANVYAFGLGPFLCVLVSRKAYRFLREPATVSGLFYRVATFEMLRREKGGVDAE
jgi:hypothetical protein